MRWFVFAMGDGAEPNVRARPFWYDDKAKAEEAARRLLEEEADATLGVVVSDPFDVRDGGKMTFVRR